MSDPFMWIPRSSVSDLVRIFVRREADGEEPIEVASVQAAIVIDDRAEGWTWPISVVSMAVTAIRGLVVRRGGDPLVGEWSARVEPEPVRILVLSSE